MYTYHCDHEILLTFAAEALVGITVLVSACVCCYGWVHGHRCMRSEHTSMIRNMIMLYVS